MLKQILDTLNILVNIIQIRESCKASIGVRVAHRVRCIGTETNSSTPSCVRVAILLGIVTQCKATLKITGTGKCCDVELAKAQKELCGALM